MSAFEKILTGADAAWERRRQGASTPVGVVAPAKSPVGAGKTIAADTAWAGASFFRQALGGWNPSAGDADAELIHDLTTLRARSLDAYRNAPLAGGAINVMEQSVVGTGLSLQPAIDPDALGWSETRATRWTAQVMRAWRRWAESPACDVTGQHNLYAIQALTFRSQLLSGDVFALLAPLPGRLGAQPAIQLIEADRVSTPQGQSDDPKLVAGIKLDGLGRAVAYHVNRAHPGSITDKAGDKYIWDEIAAYTPDGLRRMVHVYDRLRPGQTRGLPFLAPVLEQFKQLSRYSEAELQAAVISGAFAMVVQMAPDAFQDLFDDAARDQYMKNAMSWNGSYPMANLNGPGKAINLLPGETVHDSNPGRPNEAFEPFVLAILRQIGSRLGIPFEVLVHHYTSSYSASRAALLDAWRMFRVRREALAMQFCQPVYEYWLAWQVASGVIKAPGFFADPALRALYCEANWIGDGPGSINPRDDAEAAKLRVDMGISTLATESVNYDGIEWSVKHAQRVKEAALRREAGLDEAQPAPAVQQAVLPGQPEP